MNRPKRRITAGPIAAYVCRGCGTEIVNKHAFRKCPVCGIKYD